MPDTKARFLIGKRAAQEPRAAGRGDENPKKIASPDQRPVSPSSPPSIWLDPERSSSCNRDVALVHIADTRDIDRRVAGRRVAFVALVKHGLRRLGLRSPPS